MSQVTISLEDEIKARAIRLGFSVCGITTPDPLEKYPEYVNWLERGLHAEMSYLATDFHVSRRQDPTRLYPGLQSIVVFGLAYPLHNPEKMDNEPVGMISGYAAGEDYHSRIPIMVKPLLEFITSLNPGAPAPRVYTDSAPILERELAVRAGLGWIGRNSCFISPNHGSNLLLAEVFTGIPLKADPPCSTDHCGSCDRCIESCPTGCILPDRKINANRCLSYHSIENKSAIPPEIMEKFGSWIFGCDICQMVCPWNHKTLTDSDFSDKARQMSVEEMLSFLESSQSDFVINFGKTALARTRYQGLMRNILIRLAILKEKRALGNLIKIESSSDQPMLRKTAAWAKNRILSEIKQSSG